MCRGLAIPQQGVVGAGEQLAGAEGHPLALGHPPRQDLVQVCVQCQAGDVGQWFFYKSKCYLVNCSLESVSPTGPPRERGPLDIDLGQWVKQELLW